MNEQESSEVVIELAKALVDLASSVAPQWENAFYRFESDGSNVRTNGSYVLHGEAKIFDVMTQRSDFMRLKGLGERLRDSLEKNGEKFQVFLLSVDAEYNFHVEYDYTNRGRWKISKANGGSGFPGS